MRDQTGFDAFVHARSPALLRAGWLLTGDWYAAEDLVQTALARAWPKWDRLPDDAHATAYVRKVITTTFLRSRRRHWSAEVPSESFPERTESSPVDVEQRVDIVAELLRLPTRQRSVIVWRYFADLTEVETARLMGCSVGAVKSYNARALETLRAARSKETAGE